MGSCGNIFIRARFDNNSDLKSFESKSKSIFTDVQGSFDFFKLTFQLLTYMRMKHKTTLPKLLLTNTIKFL